MVLRILAAASGVTMITAAAAHFLLTDSAPPEEPPLGSAIRHGTIRVGTLERSYLFYVPAHLSGNPALLFALHGARGSGRRMRVLTAYEFDRLADANNFIVVYPDGFEKCWNDCRAHAFCSAKARNVDDVGFILALIHRFRSEFGVSSSHVFAMGFSNGGQMAYRLALEAPEVAAVAAVAANLPTKEDFECRASERPVAVMIVNGTDDPENPYAGGTTGWFRFGSRGSVLSAMETATHFSRVAGYHSAPENRRYPEIDGNQHTWVERATWDAPKLPEISLYTIHGGGHTIPQAKYRLRRLLGPTAADIDCMEEAWKFFERHMRKEDASPRTRGSL